jgi:hypothetical protein
MTYHVKVQAAGAEGKEAGAHRKAADEIIRLQEEDRPLVEAYFRERGMPKIQ